MSKELFKSTSLEEFNKIATNFSKNLKVGDIVLLNGELGAGKTTFVKAVAKSLGIDRNITSPTFTFMKEYRQNDIVLYHFDLYRVSSEEEVYELGIYENLHKDGISFIEWNKFTRFEKTPIIINILKTDNVEERIIEVENEISNI